MKPSKSLVGGIITIISMAVVIIFLMSAAAPAMSSSPEANPATATSGGIQPYTNLQSNVTWSTFNHGWSPLEYSNGTANLTLNAQLNSQYTDPISIDPADIQGIPQLKGSQSTTNWVPSAGTVDNTGNVFSENNTTGLTFTGNTSAAGTGQLAYHYEIPITKLPSNNPEYDYFTIIATGSGTTLTGESESIYLVNSTIHVSYQGPAYKIAKLYGSGTVFKTFSLEQAIKAKNDGNLNISKNPFLKITVLINFPKSVSKTFSLTVNDFMLSTSPMYVGTNGTQEITNTTGNAKMSSFNPAFPWKSVTNGGYTVAVSQPLQNLTVQQNAISSSNYIEQVEYQGSFKLPSAPDLSYGPSKLTEQFNISTSQVTVLDINGVSYLNAISGKNGTITLLSSVNPTSTTTYLEIIDYSSSQWEKVSGPPGFFSEQGFEYYFDVFILGIMALIGLGGGAAAIHLRNLRRMR